MSGPETRPELNYRSTAGRVEPETNGESPEFVPVTLPQYEARFSVERDTGEPIVSVTIVGSPRLVDQIMHSVSDAFREEVET